MSRKPLTFSYIVFYALFWPDTWQMMVGLLAAWFLTPRLIPPGSGVSAAILFYAMLAVVGYAVSGILIRPLFHRLHARMLGRNRS